jgi:FAD/FMN-containing dehydrogenase
MQKQRKTEPQRHAQEQRASTKGQDQVARDMGRGESAHHGRDQTASEMSKDTRREDKAHDG